MNKSPFEQACDYLRVEPRSLDLILRHIEELPFPGENSAPAVLVSRLWQQQRFDELNDYLVRALDAIEVSGVPVKLEILEEWQAGAFNDILESGEVAPTPNRKVGSSSANEEFEIWLANPSAILTAYLLPIAQRKCVKLSLKNWGSEIPKWSPREHHLRG